MQFGPGGDFSWLVIGAGPLNQIQPSNGHNIIVEDFGLAKDGKITKSPGGTYPADSMSCSSCHDPHGRYRVIGGTTAQVTTGAPIIDSGSYGTNPAVLPASEAIGVYRLLGGVGYNQKSTALTADDFVNPVPIAIAPVNYNDPAVLGGVRVGYGQGMSEWCANCHGKIHNNDSTTKLRHLAGNDAELGTVIANNYNVYVSSGIVNDGSRDEYLALVPFETGQGYDDIPGLETVMATTNGPVATDNVMCLSCHRAHASSFRSIMRWNNDADFLVDESGNWTPIETPEQDIAAYYNLPGSYLRFLPAQSL